MWEKIHNEKHITGFLYFQKWDQCFCDYTKEEDLFRDEQQKLFKPFLAKRMLNEYKGLLNKFKISNKYDTIHTWTFTYISFLYFCRILDKKEYVSALEQYIKINI